jgi:glycosyltransferase involved in cell wall biosynthesis
MRTSVIIPLFNKAGFVSAAIRSVLHQSLVPEEIIVVDDGSSDEGGDIAAGVLRPCDTLLRVENAGVSAARNLGFARSTGDLIALLDADDLWGPRHLEEIKRLVHQFPSCALWASAYCTFQDGAGTGGVSVSARQPLSCDFFGLSSTAPAQPFTSSNTVVARAVWSAVGGFPIGIQRTEDMTFFARAGLESDVAFGSRVTAFYRQTLSNRSFTINRLGNEIPHVIREMTAVLRRRTDTGLKSAALHRYCRVMLDHMAFNLIRTSELQAAAATWDSPEAAYLRVKWRRSCAWMTRILPLGFLRGAAGLRSGLRRRALNLYSAVKLDRLDPIQLKRMLAEIEYYDQKVQ